MRIRAPLFIFLDNGFPDPGRGVGAFFLSAALSRVPPRGGGRIWRYDRSGGGEVWS